MKEQTYDALLKAAFFRRSCPDTMTLVDFSMGWGSEAFRDALRTHLDRCPHCSEEFARMKKFVKESD